MAATAVFAIVIGALAILLIGTVLSMRNRVYPGEESKSDVYAFQDCYDLCSTNPKDGFSQSCKTECLNFGGA